jgi:hypothetical protein
VTIIPSGSTVEDLRHQIRKHSARDTTIFLFFQEISALYSHCAVLTCGKVWDYFSVTKKHDLLILRISDSSDFEVPLHYDADAIGSEVPCSLCALLRCVRCVCCVLCAAALCALCALCGDFWILMDLHFAHMHKQHSHSIRPFESLPL